MNIFAIGLLNLRFTRLRCKSKYNLPIKCVIQQYPRLTKNPGLSSCDQPGGLNPGFTGSNLEVFLV